MKQSSIILLAVVLLTSCATSRIIKISDPYKEIESLKLKLTPHASSVEKNGFLGIRQVYSLSSTYLFEAKKNEPSRLTVDILLITPLQTSEFDSVMFLNLDNEKIRIVSDEYKYKQFEEGSTAVTTSSSTTEDKVKQGEKIKDQISTSTKTTTENGNYQMMNRKFTIPENLWPSVVNSQKIQLRLYVGKEGIDVKLVPEDQTRLKEFFNRAYIINQENSPALPEGQKKW